VGPGGGAGAADALRAAIAAGRRVVADADALRDAGSLAGAALVTPHDGEFTRLFGPPGEDRIAAVRAAAAELGTVVLLKGPTTIVAAPDGEAAVAANAPPWLATAGTGDVLAGVAAAWLGNGSTPFQAACAAAWATGEAAARLGPGLLAEDLPLALPLLDPGTAIPLLSAP
jgi:NAD(P)H-hydrate repair Nnr-like enzyme with NAD(P)H-hydrate dehydratase domain